MTHTPKSGSVAGAEDNPLVRDLIQKGLDPALRSGYRGGTVATRC